jgi:RimJ/RimL family protein N-acetyltransferase
VSDLITPRLRLRPWTDADREPFARMNADPRVMEHFPGTLSRSDSDALADRIARHIDEHGWGLWAVEIPGVTLFAGYIGLSKPTFSAPFTPCVEVGWRIAHEHWGHGYATEGARAALELGFGRLGLHEIVSFTVPANVRSRRVMERLGMSRNPDDDFDHPGLPPDHRLRRHVLYRIQAPPAARRDGGCHDSQAS